MKFRKIISGIICMAFTLSSTSILGNIVVDAVNLDSPVTVNATATLENGLEYEVYEDHVEITGCDESAEGEMVIPEIIEGLPVTDIREYAFGECSFLTSIIISHGITSISMQAFDGCSSLKSVIIPDTVTSIGSYAFYGCSSLEFITIPDSVTNVDWSTFYNCSSLTSITLPNNVTNIGDYAFSNCSALESIVIPDSVTKIGVAAFSGCSALESIVIPDSVTKIGVAAFSGCSALESITILNPDCVIYDEETLSETAVIYGYPGSTAQAYAEKYNREFVALDKNQDTTAPTDSETNPEILWGDADENGKIEILDVVLMNRVYVGVDKISESGKKNADSDQDGKITLSDSMNVLKLLVHLLEQKDFPIQAE